MFLLHLKNIKGTLESNFILICFADSDVVNNIMEGNIGRNLGGIKHLAEDQYSTPEPMVYSRTFRRQDSGCTSPRGYTPEIHAWP